MQRISLAFYMKAFSTLHLIGTRNPREEESLMTIEERINLCHTKADHPERDALIKEHTPYIVKVIANHTGQYVSTSDSMSLSIGLEAFNEAIDRYDTTKGSFLPFAALVIKSRLKDWFKKSNQILKHEDMPEVFDHVEHGPTMEDRFLLKNEIQTYLQWLEKFNIRLDDLIENAPKHEKVQHENKQLSYKISKDDPIVLKLYKSKKLPMMDIIKQFAVTKKKLVTFRLSIIALVIVFREKFEGIMSFLNMGGDDYA